MILLHNENPELDKRGRIDAAAVADLAHTGYFDCGTSPACVAILPFIKPEHTGVEIGVFRGTSSTVFLDYCRHMYFIDPCFEYPDNPDKNWFTDEESYLALLEPYRGRFTWIKGMSADVADRVPEVDFIFIDGNHEYAYVMKDLKLYWPKIKSGGFLCGHDYSGGHPGVTGAVDDFFKPLGLPVEEHQYCWLVHKP